MTARRRRQLGDPLTDREMEVLRGMALGMTNLEIGKALFLSEDTIKTHARRLFDKLGTINRILAVMVGIERGLLKCPCSRRTPEPRHTSACLSSGTCQCVVEGAA